MYTHLCFMPQFMFVNTVILPSQHFLSVPFHIALRKNRHWREFSSEITGTDKSHPTQAHFSLMIEVKQIWIFFKG